MQVVYYNCVKFHKNPKSRLGGVALTRYMDGRTYGWTDGQGDSYIPPSFVCGGYNKNESWVTLFCICFVNLGKASLLRAVLTAL